MKVKATVSWGPKVKFEAASLVDIVLSLENGEREEFKGQLKNPKTVMDYLMHIAYYASSDDARRFDMGKPTQEEEGKRLYELPVAPDAHLSELRHCSNRIQEKHYLAPRDEWVTDEEYCTFFGSSGNLWDTGRCPYPRGDFVETLRQTVYDMEHGHPTIYQWTNVPCLWGVNKKIASDSQFKEFFEQKFDPLLTEFKALKRSPQSDVKGFKKIFIRMADVAESYKREHGITRFDF